MDDNDTRYEIQTETKISRLEGKFDIAISKLDNLGMRISDIKADLRSTRANIWVVGIVLAGFIVFIVASHPIFFDVSR